VNGAPGGDAVLAGLEQMEAALGRSRQRLTELSQTNAHLQKELTHLQKAVEEYLERISSLEQSGERSLLHWNLILAERESVIGSLREEVASLETRLAAGCPVCDLRNSGYNQLFNEDDRFVASMAGNCTDGAKMMVGRRLPEEGGNAEEGSSDSSLERSCSLDDLDDYEVESDEEEEEEQDEENEEEGPFKTRTADYADSSLTNNKSCERCGGLMANQLNSISQQIQALTLLLVGDVEDIVNNSLTSSTSKTTSHRTAYLQDQLAPALINTGNIGALHQHWSSRNIQGQGGQPIRRSHSSDSDRSSSGSAMSLSDGGRSSARASSQASTVRAAYPSIVRPNDYLSGARSYSGGQDGDSLVHVQYNLRESNEKELGSPECLIQEPFARTQSNFSQIYMGQQHWPVDGQSQGYCVQQQQSYHTSLESLDAIIANLTQHQHGNNTQQQQLSNNNKTQQHLRSQSNSLDDLRGFGKNENSTPSPVELPSWAQQPGCTINCTTPSLDTAMPNFNPNRGVTSISIERDASGQIVKLTRQDNLQPVQTLFADRLPSPPSLQTGQYGTSSCAAAAPPMGRCHSSDNSPANRLSPDALSGQYKNSAIFSSPVQQHTDGSCCQNAALSLSQNSHGVDASSQTTNNNDAMSVAVDELQERLDEREQALATLKRQLIAAKDVLISEREKTEEKMLEINLLGRKIDQLQRDKDGSQATPDLPGRGFILKDLQSQVQNLMEKNTKKDTLIRKMAELLSCKSDTRQVVETIRESTMKPSDRRIDFDIDTLCSFIERRKTSTLEKSI